MTDLPWGTNQNLTDEEFYNRESELINIKNLLQSTGQGHAPDLLLTGIRGVGNTVFLKKLKHLWFCLDFFHIPFQVNPLRNP